MNLARSVLLIWVTFNEEDPEENIVEYEYLFISVQFKSYKRSSQPQGQAVLEGLLFLNWKKIKKYQYPAIFLTRRTLTEKKKIRKFVLDIES